jgi:ribose transport system permease protein
MPWEGNNMAMPEQRITANKPEIKGQKPKIKLISNLKFREIGTFIGLIIICAIFSILKPNFLSPDNLMEIVLSSSINAIVAVGMTLIIMMAGIDLSVGSVAALASVVTAQLMANGTPVLLAILIGLCLGALCGAVNGVFSTVFGLQPFIVTLGTMSLIRGFALLYTNGQPVLTVPGNFKSFFAGQIGPIPMPIIVVIIIGIIALVTVKYTKLGEYIIAIGGNEDAARYAGISVNKYKIATYMISGILAALAGLILVARLGAGDPTSGSGWELTAIAASAIGGASLMGGSGSIVGTILGAIILGSLQDGLTLLNVQAYYQVAATGAIIILAMLIDRYTKK